MTEMENNKMQDKAFVQGYNKDDAYQNVYAARRQYDEARWPHRNDNYARAPMRRPKWAFDRSYTTDWRKEVEYLHEHGIEPDYIFETGRYAVTKYKFSKTAKLFALLAMFHQERENERGWNKIDKVFDKSVDMGMPDEMKQVVEKFIALDEDGDK